LFSDCAKPKRTFLLRELENQNQPSDKSKPIIIPRTYRDSLTLASSVREYLTPTVDDKLDPQITKAVFCFSENLFMLGERVVKVFVYFFRVKHIFCVSVRKKKLKINYKS
jgi:hypothetical protein